MVISLLMIALPIGRLKAHVRLLLSRFPETIFCCTNLSRVRSETFQHIAVLNGRTCPQVCDCVQATEYVMHRTKPTLLKGNKEGYTVLALSQCRQGMPSDTWRLCLVSEQPLQAWNQVPSSRQELYEGMSSTCMKESL